MSNAAQNVGRRILQEIMDDVIVPFKTQGRIKGGDLDYNSSAVDIMDAVESKKRK